MAKKGFDWVRDAEVPYTPRKDRESLSEKAEDPARAAVLATQLTALPPAEWAHLELDSSLIEALELLGRIRSKSRAARKRQLGFIANLLLQHDLDAIEGSIGGRQTDREAHIEALVRWRARLVEEGDAALTEFLELHPTADRQRLRQLTNQCRKVTEGPKHTASMRSLLEALKDADGVQ